MTARAVAAQLTMAAAGLASRRRFRAALDDPAPVQAARLRQYLDRHRDTAFGRAHRFDLIGSVADYQRRVPIATYDDLEPYVDRVAAGERGVLTGDVVLRLQPSSGSTTAVKRIPYTRALQRELSRAVQPWLADLYLTRPRLLGGRAYWSITPAVAPSPAARPATPVPVGFEDDSTYLGGPSAWLARAALVVPPMPLGPSFDVDEFRRVTLCSLLRARDLRLVSIWHPSFLAVLLDTLASDWATLVDRIARSDRARAGELRLMHAADLRAIWPRLSLVSCWGDGPAHAPAAALAERLNGIDMQQKGLMATEGVVTIPFAGRRPVAVRSHFYEFVDDDGRARLVDQLDDGRQYVVLLTTGGGLYRYRLGDRVRVDGYVGRTPSLTFVGRDDSVCDWCGEKLSDGFVAGVLDRLCAGPTRPRFAMLAPDDDGAGRAYTLFVDRDFVHPELARSLEQALRGNPHYAWCVDLGQLRPARVAAVGPAAARQYLDSCAARGRRLGDVKPVCLDSWPGWRQVLSC